MDNQPVHFCFLLLMIKDMWERTCLSIAQYMSNVKGSNCLIHSNQILMWCQVVGVVLCVPSHASVDTAILFCPNMCIAIVTHQCNVQPTNHNKCHVFNKVEYTCTVK